MLSLFSITLLGLAPIQSPPHLTLGTPPKKVSCTGVLAYGHYETTVLAFECENAMIALTLSGS